MSKGGIKMKKLKVSPNFSPGTEKRFKALPLDYQWLIFKDIKDAFETRLKMFEEIVYKQ